MDEVLFASSLWIKAFFELARQDDALLSSLRKFKGPMCLVMGAQPPQLGRDLVVWLDAGQGQVRALEQVAHPDTKPWRFLIRAPYSVWERIARERKGLFKALLTGKLRVQGPKTELLRHRRTAAELGRLLGELPTRFP